MSTFTYPLFGHVLSGNARGPIFGTFMYRADDPFTVVLWFPNNQHWAISRELLAEGIDLAAGDPEYGDVLVQRHDHDVHITLRSPFGQAVLSFSHTQLRTALAETEKIVPLGAEKLDWDAELRLLGGAR